MLDVDHALLLAFCAMGGTATWHTEVGQIAGICGGMTAGKCAGHIAGICGGHIAGICGGMAAGICARKTP